MRQVDEVCLQNPELVVFARKEGVHVERRPLVVRDLVARRRRRVEEEKLAEALVVWVAAVWANLEAALAVGPGGGECELARLLHQQALWQRAAQHVKDDQNAVAKEGGRHARIVRQERTLAGGARGGREHELGLCVQHAGLAPLDALHPRHPVDVCGDRLRRTVRRHEVVRREELSKATRGAVRGGCVACEQLAQHGRLGGSEGIALAIVAAACKPTDHL
mmetsp:Transcript_20380/g.47047  ORF Transcript_20380/g.47047 Transcript_20380/m.47047 type:complete len:220 (+) Transcript_20380:1354-2013(+)